MENPATLLPSQLCLICTSSTAPPNPPIPDEGTSGEKGKASQITIKCEPTLTPINPDVNGDWNSLENNAEDCDIDNTTDTGNSVGDIKAVFILRKLLNYPKRGCIKYLQFYGVNPGNWFTLCPSCNEKVSEGYRLHRQLQQLERRWVEVTKEFRNEIYNGKVKHVGSSHKTKHVWQDVRDYVCDNQMKIAEVQIKQPCIPEQLTVDVEPGSIGYSNDDITLFEPMDFDQDEDEGSDWEPEQKPLLEQIGLDNDVSSNSSDDESNSNSDTELEEDFSVSEVEDNSELETSRRSKRKGSQPLIKIKAKTTKTTKKPPRKIKVEPVSTVVRDPSVNPHIPLPPESHHSYKCHLCVGFYYQRVKFDKHKALHETQGGIPCAFCGWYHKAEFMRFHVHHFHNPKNPRVVKEGKRIYKPKNKKAKVEGYEDKDKNKGKDKATAKDLGNIAKKSNKKQKVKLEEIVYYCDHCEMKSLHENSILLHFEAFHKEQETLRCQICNEHFVSKQLLQIHTNILHPSDSPQAPAEDEDVQSESAYPCSHCTLVFNSTFKLDYHVLKHHKKIKWTCHCGLKTGQYSVYKAHLLTHTGEKPFECHLCNKAYRVGLNLKNHFRQVHHKELGMDPLKCTICEVSCVTSQALRIHMEVTHGSQKTHCCEICGKMSGTKHNLKIHMKIHENDTTKPSHYVYADGRYNCAFCDASYAQNRNIVKHLRTTHPEQCEFKCAGCDTQYCSIQGLRKHQALCEPYRQSLPALALFNCKECDQVFSIKHQLRDHVVKVHCKYECDACGHKVNSENMMLRHKSKCFGTKLSKHARTKAKKAKTAATMKNERNFDNFFN